MDYKVMRQRRRTTREPETGPAVSLAISDRTSGFLMFSPHVTPGIGSVAYPLRLVPRQRSLTPAWRGQLPDTPYGPRTRPVSCFTPPALPLLGLSANISPLAPHRDS